jgi:hypothetical protein
VDVAALEVLERIAVLSSERRGPVVDLVLDRAYLFLNLNAVQLIPTRRMNCPVTITDRNREGFYALGREMLPAVKVCTLLILLAVEWGAIDAANRRKASTHRVRSRISPYPASHPRAGSSTNTHLPEEREKPH